MDGVFLKWSRTFVEFCEFRETDKSLKHELASISYMCLTGAVVACWSLTGELAGLHFRVLLMSYIFCQ